MHDVFKLADIAGPVVREQGLLGVRRQAGACDAQARPRIAGQEMARQRQDVAGALIQRRSSSVATLMR
jgi:hypothetical protein